LQLTVSQLIRLGVETLCGSWPDFSCWCHGASSLAGWRVCLL